MNLCVCRKEVVLPAFICGVAVSCAVLLEGLFVLMRHYDERIF